MNFLQLVIVAAVVVAITTTATLTYAQPGYGGGQNAKPTPEQQCISCQLIVWDRWHTFRRQPIGAYKGATEVAINEVLEHAAAACQNSHDIVPHIPKYNMEFSTFLDGCNYVLDEEETMEYLEENIARVDEPTLRKTACARHCASDALWSVDETPDKLELPSEKNMRDAMDFMMKNKDKEGVYTTGTGLQYVILQPGTGKQHPKKTSNVKVHYHGTLPLTGEVFDSSVDRGEPATFGLNQVIAGWTEGLQLMTVGAKYRFFVPPTLGYGEQGGGPKIGPNVVLQFDVELLEILKTEKRMKAPMAPPPPSLEEEQQRRPPGGDPDDNHDPNANAPPPGSRVEDMGNGIEMVRQEL